MNIIKTAIDGVVIIEPRIFEDARGYFFESFSQREFDKLRASLACYEGIKRITSISFVQQNVLFDGRLAEYKHYDTVSIIENVFNRFIS